ncbi:MAG: EthD domain-containing protein [Steroidobacteraceae bacterium]
MIKIIVLIKRNPKLTKEQFQAHYEGVHANLALQYIRPFLLDYRRSYPLSSFSYFDAVEAPGEVSRQAYDYDCITELWVADRPAMEAMFAKLSEPATRKTIAEDEERFLDPKSVVMITCEEHRSSIT